MSEAERPQNVRLTPTQAKAALLVLDEYVDDSSMDMRENLIAVCKELREVADNQSTSGRPSSTTSSRGGAPAWETSMVCVWCGLPKLSGVRDSRCHCDNPKYEEMGVCSACEEWTDADKLYPSESGEYVCPSCDAV